MSTVDYSPAVLTDGRWVPNGRGTVVWVSDRPTPAEVARLKAEAERAKATKSRPSIAADDALRAAAALFEVGLADLLVDDRRRPLVDARGVAMWLMRRSGYPYQAIGRALGRDHTTVIHHVRRVQRDPDLLAVASEVRVLLTGEVAA